jgi:hypothetical protein
MNNRDKKCPSPPLGNCSMHCSTSCIHTVVPEGEGSKSPSSGTSFDVPGYTNSNPTIHE